MKRFFLFILAVLFSAAMVYAQIDVYLSLSATGKRSDIAIEYFAAADGKDDTVKYAKLLKEIIENDLILSRYFNIVQDIPKDADTTLKERLFSWEKKGASVLLTASVSIDRDKLVLEANLIDVVSGETIWKHKYKNEILNYSYYLLIHT